MIARCPETRWFRLVPVALALSALSLACSSSDNTGLAGSGGNGGVPEGTGGRGGTGGAVFGTGGRVGTGGAAAGIGGAVFGTGGSDAGANEPDAAPGTGGSAAGTGGSAAGTGGSAAGTGGSAAGTGGTVAGHCTNGVQDADETDVDCGGSCGASCKDTGPQQKCQLAGDCKSGVCSGRPLYCEPPNCADGVRNGNETDVDCGGAGFGGAAACPKCLDKLHCAGNVDCLNNFCFAGGSGPGTCVSCGDHVTDGNETDVDCGGPQCPVCGPGKACFTITDCGSGTSNECVFAGCASNVCVTRNYDQTHVLSAGQTTGDCQKLVCNGLGGSTSMDDPSDLPTADSVCVTAPACTAATAGGPLRPSFTNATLGTNCKADGKSPAQVCSGSGTCVQCNTSADCTPIIIIGPPDAGIILPMIPCVNNVCE